MTHTEDALYISTGIIYFFGVPFLLLTADALTTDNQAIMVSLSFVGFAITLFCAAIIIMGVWLD